MVISDNYQPRLFGINQSNRDFTKKSSWGKNQFNSSFPAALACYMSCKNLQPVYLKLNHDLTVNHGKIDVSSLFGLHYDNCLDIFMWSNLAFTRLFIDAAKSELNSDKITRHKRCVVWLAKMLYDFANTSKINHTATIDEISLNTKNDKAFALSGSKTHQYMKSPELTKPRIKQEEINNIILGGGEKLLSPERRFDAIILNTPNLFDWNRFKIYRVSEKKKAFFLIGVHQGKDNELIPYLEKNLSKKSMTVRDYMGINWE